MSVSSIQLSCSLWVAVYFSKRNGISSWTEPDDILDNYIDFLEHLSYDWGNDDYLLELIDNVFARNKNCDNCVIEENYHQCENFTEDNECTKGSAEE